MNTKRIISIIVIFLISSIFILTAIAMITSKSLRDGFVQTVKDIKKKPFMAPERNKNKQK
ncbi:MAG: hypothetical protein ACPL4C_03135 [Brevinematia bacterium]|jgi:amino acid permease